MRYGVKCDETSIQHVARSLNVQGPIVKHATLLLNTRYPFIIHTPVWSNASDQNIKPSRNKYVKAEHIRFPRAPNCFSPSTGCTLRNQRSRTTNGPRYATSLRQCNILGDILRDVFVIEMVFGFGFTRLVRTTEDTHQSIYSPSNDNHSSPTAPSSSCNLCFPAVLASVAPFATAFMITNWDTEALASFVSSQTKFTISLCLVSIISCNKSHTIHLQHALLRLNFSKNCFCFFITTNNLRHAAFNAFASFLPPSDKTRQHY